MKKNAVFEDVLNTVTRLFVIAVIAILIFICFSGVRFIKSGNVALILRFGKLVGDSPEEQVHDAGLLFAFPYIIDEVITVPTGSIIEQTIETHFKLGSMTELEENGYVITGDQNIAVLSASLKYNITDPIAYALNVKDIESVINACVSNAMVESAARMQVDDILTSQKEKYTSDTINRAQKKLNDARTGISVSSLELTYVGMPKEVRDIYEAVNSATVNANTQIENANQYRETTIPEAEAKANAVIAAANSEYASSISAANADLAEFWGVLEEYKNSSALVKTRIYNEKISEAISKIGKIKVVTDGDSSIIIN